MPSPTAIASSGQHNISTFAMAASNNPWFHTKIDNALCVSAPSAASQPSVAAPELRQNSLTRSIKSHDSPNSTSDPTQRSARPSFALPSCVLLLCSFITPPGQLRRPSRPTIGPSQDRKRGEFGGRGPLTGERRKERGIQNGVSLAYRRKGLERRLSELIAKKHGRGGGAALGPPVQADSSCLGTSGFVGTARRKRSASSGARPRYGRHTISDAVVLLPMRGDDGSQQPAGRNRHPSGFR